MNAPRLEIDLGKIHHNARTLVELLSPKGITVTGVTKAFLGLPQIASTLLRAGIRTLGDSRIENIQTMRHAQLDASMELIRSPMLSQIDQVVAHADISLNSELDVIRQLSVASQKIKCTHGVVLMVELGDLREGIMPSDLENVVREIQHLPNIEIIGIGTNLACRSGVSPDAKNMSELSALADTIDASCGTNFRIVSGGNSGNLQWALSTTDTGRINDLRLGESILLGCETLHRQPIEGLYTDAITLVAEVIESKLKPAQAWGTIAQNAFGESLAETKAGNISQSILAIGHQDIDPAGLSTTANIKILGASSDHLIVVSDDCLPIGSEIRFQLNYSALVRAMTSPFVIKVISTP